VTRTLTAAMVTAAQAATGEIFHLFDFEFAGSDWTLVAEAKFDAASGTKLRDYTADSGFGTLNLGSGAGPSLKPDIFRPETAIDNLFSPAEFFAATKEVQRNVAEGDFVVDGHRVGDVVTISGSDSNDGVFTLVTVAAQSMTFAETIVDETSSSPTTNIIGPGYAQNAILVGGPEANVGSLDVANDNLKICATAERVQFPFQVGLVIRSNHTTTSDTGVDYFRFYLKNNGDNNVDVIVQKRIGNRRFHGSRRHCRIA